MKRILLLTILVCAAANANAAPAPVSPLQPKASSVSEVEAKSLETQKETDLLKNIDAILSGKFDKTSEYRPPLPLTQRHGAVKKQKQRPEPKFLYGQEARPSKSLYAKEWERCSSCPIGTALISPFWPTA